MLKVVSLSEAQDILNARFGAKRTEIETVALSDALSRVLARDIAAREDVPGFDRSSVDGYAVRAEDTFGCSESIPALLECVGEIKMGEKPELEIKGGECAYIPTGGELPRGANAAVMIEFCEGFNGQVAIQKPCAPGQYLVFRGDDVRALESVLRAGAVITSEHIGALAALGAARLEVARRPRVSIISTGDEIVPPDSELKGAQIRDVNGPMLAACSISCGCEVISGEIIRDDRALIKNAVESAARESDLVLLSGGSSAGARDEAADIITELGELLFHGIAVKPGKPTLAGDVGGTPVLGLPGHPVAARFIFELLAKPLIEAFTGARHTARLTKAALATALSSNHGREEYIPVRLEGDAALPIIGKSGLITTLAAADGYIKIGRDREGYAAGERVEIFLL